LGGVSPLAFAYMVEARAKERFRNQREHLRHLLLLLNVAFLGVLLATGLAAGGGGGELSYDE
jgi:hypothetical protein